MLDIPAYRAAESIAKAQLPSWRTLQVHRLDAFEAVGFPSRVDSMAELGMFLNAMHEGRTGAYQAELGELTPSEGLALALARTNLDDFAATWFPQVPAPKPHGPLSCLTIDRKLRNAAPGFTRILEIGPGCGYLSLFLRQNKDLARYVSIEVCEAFYLIQHMVNAWCFGSKAEDLVLGQRPNAICTHVPWWHIGHVAQERFDVVTANACLLEFTPKALKQYLSLAATVLEPRGKFVAQCLGRWQNGTADTLVKDFEAHGFKLLSLTKPEETKSPVYNAVWERI